MTRSLRTLPLLSSVLIAGAIGPVNVLVFSLFWVLGPGKVPTQNPAQRQPTSVSFRQRLEGDAKSGSKLTKHLPSRAGLGSEVPREAGKKARTAFPLVREAKSPERPISHPPILPAHLFFSLPSK
jgi:hypothetical protein